MSAPAFGVPIQPATWADVDFSLRAWRGKRLFDILGALILLVVLAPLFLVTAAAVALTSPGPVCFRQRRVGFGGQEFQIFKFRTMRADAEERLYGDAHLLQLYRASGHKISQKLDPRVTPLGRFLRRSSIDEMPQLFNVLRGDMSLVGPRPVERAQVTEYRDLPFAYLSIRPGLTGLWQVSGRSRIGFPERGEIDAEYYRRCSLGADMAILARTVWAVLACRGAD